MAHQIFKQVLAVKAAASKLEGVNKIHGTRDYSGLQLHNLKYETRKLRNIINNARREHANEFGASEAVKCKAIDLMEMGY